MNVEVVDNTIRDLDLFSPASKPVQWSLQSKAIEEVDDFRDLSEVALDNTLDVKYYDPTEQKINMDLYEGLSDKVVTKIAIQFDPVLQQLKSPQHRDLANLGLRKRMKQLAQSFDTILNINIVLVPPNTQNKDKEGPSTEKIGRKGIGRKVRRRPLWQEQSHPTKVISRNR